MFNAIVKKLDLRAIALLCRQFTWVNNLPSLIYELMDHVLMSVEWEQTFPLVMVCALQRSTSDHTSLLLNSSGQVKAHFSFETSLFEREGFLNSSS